MTSLFEFDPRTDAIDALHALTNLYTCDPVIDVLLDRVDWPNRGGDLLDPAAGNGNFVLRALARLDIAPDDLDLAHRIHGLEIHPGAVAEARQRVSSYLITHGGWRADIAAHAAAQMISQGDFLAGDAPHRTFDTIAGNPPYLRFAHLPDAFKLFYRDSLPDHARGDLLHAFIDRCVAILPPNGAICCVTADRWLFNETAARLRTIIGQRVGLDHVARLDATSAFHRPKFRKRGTPPRIHPVEILLRPVGAAAMPITGAPISPDQLTRPQPSAERTLADVADVRIAPWLGPPGIFTVTRQFAADAGFPAGDLVPAVDTDDIDPADDVLRSPTRVAIRTCPTIAPTGAIAAHLTAHRDRMPRRKGNRPWWMPPEAITLPLDRPSLLIPRIARQLRAIPLPAGHLVINHNISVATAHPGVDLDQLKTAVTSEASQAWIAANAPRLENGFYSISTRLLRRLPVELPSAP